MPFTKEEILSYKYSNDPRDIPNELKNFKLLITKCNYVLEHLNIVHNDGEIWKLSDKEIDEESLLLKNLNLIFNKISSENYDAVIMELIKLEKINNKNIINKSIDILIKNIKTNQVFGRTYAKLCKDIQDRNLWEYTESGKTIYFHTILIKKVQEECIKIMDNDIRKNDIEGLNKIDDEEEKYEMTNKCKKKYNGVILLIGYLYIYKMINDTVIDTVIKCLCSPFDNNSELPDAWNLDFLYNLITSLDNNYDINTSKRQDIKNVLIYLTKDKRLSNKIRFKFLNITDKFNSPTCI